MLRLLHHCLIIACLAGSLMLLPLCCAELELISEYEDSPTSIPDYDYNATFDYSFFSNSSTEDLEKFILEKESEDEQEDISQTQTEVPGSNTAFRTLSLYPSSLLMLILAAHHLLRLL